MSLSLDAVFLDAIEADDAIMSIIGGRRWCTAAPMPEESFLENVDVPYIIVKFDGFTVDDGTKDDSYDSGDDTVQIGITVTGKSNEQLDDLVSRVRRAIHRYMIDHADEEGIPYSTRPSGGRKYYDEDKPCFGIDLTYQCAATFNLEDEDEQEE